jgi:hypothetical protein
MRQFAYALATIPRGLLASAFLCACSSAAAAAPAIYMNTGTPTACVLTPTTTTVLTVDTTGNVLAVGTLSGPCTGSTPIPPIPPDPGVCVPGPSGDLGSLGYSRMCSGAVRSLNSALKPAWTVANNTYSAIMSAPWTGAPQQFGWGLVITVNAQGFGSFRFNTGATVAGVSFESNTSYGSAGTISVSTVAGDTFGGTALCAGQVARLSTKADTKGNCKLALNTDYYLNVSMANYFAPHGTMCGAASCATGWTVYLYSN